MARASNVLIEAESFTELGGWVVDQQFMDQMGSPFLLAHGLGRPVSDAIERVRDGRLTGKWKLWVRTRDWVSPRGPGSFVVQIFKNDGDLPEKILETKILGVGNGEWHWEDCGSVVIPQGDLEVRLHDLTGFEGRCDALMFVPADADAKPEAEWDDWAWRRKLLGLPDEIMEKEFDFVVVGGGYAGLCAAVAAARSGIKTAIVQDRPVFGGNASSEVRVGPIGRLGLPPFPRNSDLAYELVELTRGNGETSGGVRPPPDDARVAKWLAEEDNLTCLISCRGTEVEKVGSTIRSVVVRDVRHGDETRLVAKLFCDATGDGWLARAAGAEVRVVPESREETGETLAPRRVAKSNGGYGATNYWLTRWADGETTFPACPWAILIEEDFADVGGGKSTVRGDYPYAAGWNWESGINIDNVASGEAIRDYNFRAAYGMWDYLKNKSSDRARYAKAEMSWMAYVLGKRAAGRIVGDYVLCEQDLAQHRLYPDGVVTTTWYLDMHFPHPRNSRHFPGSEFRSLAYDDPNFEQEKTADMAGCYTPIKPYPIPYRCFYAKDITNLFMAGKDISCTHVAMASVRVENTVAQMGQVVGLAAALCVMNAWTPRKLGESHFKVLARRLRNPWPQTRLCRLGQGRRTVGNEIHYRMRRLYHRFKRLVGRPYLEELCA